MGAGTTPAPAPVLLRTRRPHILVVDHVAELSGGQLAMARLAEALGDAVDVTFLYAAEGPVCDRVRAAGRTVVVSDVGEVRERRIADVSLVRDAVRFGPSLLAAARTVAAEARARSADLVYTNSQKAHVYGGLGARMAGVPWIAHMRDILRPPYVGAPLARAMDLFLRCVRPSGIIANSPATAQAVPKVAPWAVIPSGATRAPHVAERPPGLAWPTLALLGRIVPWKGQDVAIDALPAVIAAFPEARLVIGGDASHGDSAYHRDLLERVDARGLAGHVRFTGFVPDPYAFFAAADLALLTSRSPEPFGQVVVEALSVGRPVVATEGGGPSSILAGGAGGVLVPPDDPAALAAAVTGVLSDGRTAARLGLAAVRRARDFSIAESARRTLRFIDAVAPPAPAPGAR